MKKKKLKLDSLEVNSFTTKLTDEDQQRLNGGTTTPACTPLNVSIAVVTAITVYSIMESLYYEPGETADPMETPCPVTPIVTRADLATCNNGPNC